MMKKKTLLMSALAVVLAAGMTIAPAMAYFTDHTEASGRVQVSLGDQTNIDEPEDPDITSDSVTKHVVITNKDESNEELYIRAKAFAPSNLTVNYSGDGWSDGGDSYCYYEGTIMPGESTEELLVEITGIEASKDGETLNVAVIYETSKVLYDENGNKLASDWTMEADVVETEVSE